jgi:hypothetical protein
MFGASSGSVFTLSAQGENAFRKSLKCQELSGRWAFGLVRHLCAVLAAENRRRVGDTLENIHVWVRCSEQTKREESE